MLSVNILSPFQTSFTVKTNCNILAHSLQVKHGIYAKIGNDLTDHIITATKNKSLYYNISFKNEKYLTDLPLKKIEDIMYETREYDKNIFAIHGSAVEYRDCAYLFAAATTSGKTTLTAYLVSNGFGYITDDCILLDRENFNIYPFQTPMHLRKGGYEVLKQYGCAPECLFLNDISIKRYIYMPDNCVTHPVQLKKIFFIERTKDTNCIEKMSTNEKIAALLKAPITEYSVDRDYLLFLSKLTSVPCEKLYYSDMEFVMETIKTDSKR